MTERVKAPNKPGRPPAIKPKLVVETPPAVETPLVVETPPVEKVNTGHEEKPLVDAKQPVNVVGAKYCPDHPKSKAKLYGMCVACYDKLKASEKRGLYLTARLHGCNAHSYPFEMRKTWKRELDLIEAGLWKRPLKTKRKQS
jgi:hypothetical protein